MSCWRRRPPTRKGRKRSASTIHEAREDGGRGAPKLGAACARQPARVLSGVRRLRAPSADSPHRRRRPPDAPSERYKLDERDFSGIYEFTDLIDRFLPPAGLVAYDDLADADGDEAEREAQHERGDEHARDARAGPRLDSSHPPHQLARPRERHPGRRRRHARHHRRERLRQIADSRRHRLGALPRVEQGLQRRRARGWPHQQAHAQQHDPLLRSARHRARRQRLATPAHRRLLRRGGRARGRGPLGLWRRRRRHATRRAPVLLCAARRARPDLLPRRHAPGPGAAPDAGVPRAPTRR